MVFKEIKIYCKEALDTILAETNGEKNYSKY